MTKPAEPSLSLPAVLVEVAVTFILGVGTAIGAALLASGVVWVVTRAGVGVSPGQGFGLAFVAWLGLLWGIDTVVGVPGGEPADD